MNKQKIAQFTIEAMNLKNHAMDLNADCLVMTQDDLREEINVICQILSNLNNLAVDLVNP